MDRFGEKLKTLRQQHGLTQRALGQLLGVNYSWVGSLEAQRRKPNVAMLLKICDIFRVSADLLIRDELDLPPARAVDLPGGEVVLVQRFGEKLRQLRAREEVSQRALAAALAISADSFISELESGKKKPSAELVLRLALYFGVTTDQLLRDELAV